MLSLSPEQLAEVRAILITHIPDRDVYAFGSRVEGNAGKHSDLDLAIDGPVALDLRVLDLDPDAIEPTDALVDVVRRRDHKIDLEVLPLVEGPP